MNNMKIFFPLSLKNVTFYIYCTSKVRNQIKVPPSQQRKCPLTLSTAFSFIWLVKRNKNQKEEPNLDDLPTVLGNADKLLENGLYEECYNMLIRYQRNDVEIQWRICRAMYNLSKEIKYDKKYRKHLIVSAFDIISSLVDKHEDNYAVQKWYALLLDAKSSLEGTKSKIKELVNIKKHMDRAVALNPTDATTLYMLGEWCFQVSSIPWHQRKIAELLFGSPPYSSYQDALEYFQRAEAVKPRFYSLNLLRLGTCYLKLKKEDQAKYYLQLAASYPAKSNDDYQANTEAAEYLKKMNSAPYNGSYI